MSWLTWWKKDEKKEEENKIIKDSIYLIAEDVSNIEIDGTTAIVNMNNRNDWKEFEYSSRNGTNWGYIDLTNYFSFNSSLITPFSNTTRIVFKWNLISITSSSDVNLKPYSPTNSWGTPLNFYVIITPSFDPKTYQSSGNEIIIDNLELREDTQNANYIFYNSGDTYMVRLDIINLTVDGITINNKKSTNVCVNGIEDTVVYTFNMIPSWVYEKLLPLSEKGYINSSKRITTKENGKFHVSKIYSTVPNSNNYSMEYSMDLKDYGELENVFENFYIYMLIVEDTENNRKICSKIKAIKVSGAETEAKILYYLANMEIYIEDGRVIFPFERETGNEFLKRYVIKSQGEGEDADVQGILAFCLNETSSTLFRENLRKEISFECEELSINSKEKNIIVDLIPRNELYEDNGYCFRIYYYENENNSNFRYQSKYEYGPRSIVNNLYLTYGNEQGMLPSEDIFIGNNQIKLPLQTVDTSKLANSTGNIPPTNIYYNNSLNENDINLIVSGTIPKWVYEKLPLPASIKSTNVEDVYEITEEESQYKINTINQSAVPNEYLEGNSSLNLIEIEDANNIDISKFGESITEDGSIVNQNIFISLIIAYRSDAIKNKFTKSKLKSRNQVVSHGKTFGDGEVEYADTQYRFGNPNLVQSAITPSGEDDYDAIRLNFNDQNNSGFLSSSVIEEGNEYTLVLDLNKDVSQQFRSIMINNENILLYVDVMKVIDYDLFFYSQYVTKIKIYYYDANENYVDEPMVYTNTNVETKFKTKVNNVYVAYTEDYLTPCDYEFKKENGNCKIVVREQSINYIDIINILQSTTFRVSRNNKIIRSQKINLFVNGEMPAWVFKEVLPLQWKVGNKTNYRYVMTRGSGIVYGEEYPMLVDDLQIIGINDKPNIENVLFPTVGHSFSNFTYTGSSIDLSNISDGTAVANKDVFDRMSIGNNKVFFVNKVTLLERFKEKINIDGVFQYYEGEPTTPKNCVYNAEDPESGDIIYTEDWALKLPECYEGCELDGTKLTVKFGEYLEIDYGSQNFIQYDYLFKNLLNNGYYYLDISMKTGLDLSNITTLNIYLDILKYITWSIAIKLLKENKVKLIFNVNGFLENKEISSNIIKQKIDKCYLIYEKYENVIGLNRNNILIKPSKDALSSEGYIELGDYFFIYSEISMEINYLKCTNIFQLPNPSLNKKFPPNTEVNLLVSGVIPKWLSKYFYKDDKALPIRVKSNGTRICELVESNGSTEVTDEYFMITSINALPAPGIGIDNSDPDDQCSLNLEDFMPQTDSGNDGGDNDNGEGGDSTNGDGGNDPSGGSTGN